MIKVERPHVYGIMDALRGMRNPLNSWDRGDSKCICDKDYGNVLSVELGPNDEKLCKRLVVGGSPHRKYLRQIFVTMDITAPAMWWAEMDTYKSSTTRNSCSLQHKGDSRDFTIGDFSVDAADSSFSSMSDADRSDALRDIESILSIVNKWRRKYVDGKKENYGYFRLMREYLPMGYNYKATWSGNYENLLNIYEWRHSHKLAEWQSFCNVIETLPLMDKFVN